MSDLTDLYKHIVKQTRVIRNVTRSHKDAIASKDIDETLMTPYERGRLTRACSRLGRDLCVLVEDHDQAKMMWCFFAYVSGIGVNPNMFSKPGSSYWGKLWNICETMIHDKTMLPYHNIIAIEHVGTMLDIQLSSVPARVVQLKLSL